MHAHITQKMNWMLRWAHLCREMSSIFHYVTKNIRSIRVNLQNFESYLQLLNIEFSVIGITETWLDDISCLLYTMPNYNFIENHRNNKSGGGVAIFLRDGIPFKQRTDLSVFNEYCESCFIEIECFLMLWKHLR